MSTDDASGGGEGDGEADPEIEIFEDPQAAAEPERPRCHVIAFAAGRGGTGRSVIATNVAIYLAQAGKKVVAIDADPGGGPLHQLLGAPRPARGYGELLRGRVQDLAELLVDTPVAGVRLVGGENSTLGSMKAKQSAKA